MVYLILATQFPSSKIELWDTFPGRTSWGLFFKSTKSRQEDNCPFVSKKTILYLEEVFEVSTFTLFRMTSTIR